MHHYSNANANVKSKTLLDAALDFRERFDWNVFPVNGKRPLIKWLPLETQKLPINRLKQAFASPNATGIATLTGRISDNLVIRDYDKEEGILAYHDWLDAHSKLAKRLPMVKTARGYHVLFRCKQNHYVENIYGEYRGDSRHFTLVPPSIHPDTGDRYKWLQEPEQEIPWVRDPVKAGFLDYWEEEKLASVSQNSLENAFNQVCICNNTVTSSLLSLSHRMQLADKASSKFLERSVQIFVNFHMPEEEGQRHRKLFSLARSIKWLRDTWTKADLGDAFSLWWSKAKDIVRTKKKATSWFEFRDAFYRCCYPENVDWKAIQKEVAERLLSRSCLYSSHTTEYLMHLCFVFSKRLGSQTFPLSGQKAAELVGCSLRSIRTAFAELVEDKRLELVSRGSNLTHRPSVYRYWGPR